MSGFAQSPVGPGIPEVPELASVSEAPADPFAPEREVVAPIADAVAVGPVRAPRKQSIWDAAIGESHTDPFDRAGGEPTNQMKSVDIAAHPGGPDPAPAAAAPSRREAGDTIAEVEVMDAADPSPWTQVDVTADEPLLSIRPATPEPVTEVRSMSNEGAVVDLRDSEVPVLDDGFPAPIVIEDQHGQDQHGSDERVNDQSGGDQSGGDQSGGDQSGGDQSVNHQSGGDQSVNHQSGDLTASISGTPAADPGALDFLQSRPLADAGDDGDDYALPNWMAKKDARKDPFGS